MPSGPYVGHPLHLGAHRNGAPIVWQHLWYLCLNWASQALRLALDTSVSRTREIEINTKFCTKRAHILQKENPNVVMYVSRLHDESTRNASTPPEAKAQRADQETRGAYKERPPRRREGRHWPPTPASGNVWRCTLWGWQVCFTGAWAWKKAMCHLKWKTRGRL